MSADEAPGRRRLASRPATCPPWCTVRHGVRTGEDDDLHLGGALLVKQTVVRLCARIDSRTGAIDGPRLMLGSDEYTPYEAEVLIGALTQLVEHAASSIAAQEPEGAGPVLDPELA